MDNDFSERLMSTFLELIRQPSISGTPDENIASDKIYEIFSEMPYFAANQGSLKKHKIPGDWAGRDFVTALYRSPGNTRKTIVLTGHHDVVDVEPYGTLRELAFSPVELTKRVGELSLDEESAEDLASGEWLFGRGVNDMKHGLALCIELIRDITQKNDLAGNILFLSVPCEEYNSEGMLASVHELVRLQEEEGLEYVNLLLPEPCIAGKGSPMGVSIGAAGKMNLLFFFQGRSTHVSNAFDGLNVNVMASELTRLFDLNTDFCDLCEGQRGVPPSCLKQADLKELYNVSTPAYAASFFNLEILNSKTDDLIQRVKAVAVQAFRNAIDLYYKRADEYRKAGDGRFFAELSFETRVVTYGELLAEVRKISGDAFDKHIKGKIREWEKAGRDKQTISIYIVRELLDFYQDKNPVIVIGFAPPYYPARFPDLSRPEYQRLYENVDAMIAQAQADYGVHLEKYKFFGVSDFSYIECGDREGIGTVAENLLGLGETYQFPAEALSRLAIPGIVFGCWGKDAHKFTERVQVPYSFGMLPALVRDFIYRTFAAG